MPEPAEIALFFDLIAASLPAEISGKLEWVVRSPEQEAVDKLLQGLFGKKKKKGS